MREGEHGETQSAEETRGLPTLLYIPSDWRFMHLCCQTRGVGSQPAVKRNTDGGVFLRKDHEPEQVNPDAQQQNRSEASDLHKQA